MESVTAKGAGRKGATGRVVSWDDREPTKAALRAIDAEWPLIAAELAVLDAEITALSAHPAPSELDRRRLRRTQSRLTRVMAEETRRAGRGGLDGAA